MYKHVQSAKLKAYSITLDSFILKKMTTWSVCDVTCVANQDPDRSNNNSVTYIPYINHQQNIF